MSFQTKPLPTSFHLLPALSQKSRVFTSPVAENKQWLLYLAAWRYNGANPWQRRDTLPSLLVGVLYRVEISFSNRQRRHQTFWFTKKSLLICIGFNFFQLLSVASPKTGVYVTMDWLPLKCMGLEYRAARNGVMGLHRNPNPNPQLNATTLFWQPHFF